MKKSRKIVAFMLSMATLFPVANGLIDVPSVEKSIVASASEVSTAEAVADTVMDNYSVWSELLTCEDGNKGVTFLDIDFDGELELVVANQQGTDRDTYLKAYKIDTENNSLIGINNNEYGYMATEWGECADILNGTENFKLYRAVKDNDAIESFTGYNKDDIFYVSTDYTGTADWIQSVLMRFGTSQYHVLKTIDYNDTITYYNFYVDGSVGDNEDSSFEITKDEYDTLLNGFYANLQDLSLTYSIVGKQGTVTTEDLIQSYNAFSYDGFTSGSQDVVTTNSKCGDNAYWSFDDATGTLTISGTGNTYDYTFENAPFTDWDSNMVIKHIVVEEGITSIGNYLFFVHSYNENEPLYHIESISLPDTVTRIGDWAIAGFTDNLKEINIPSNLEEIGADAFTKWGDANITNSILQFTLPKSVNVIGEHAIGYIGGDGATYYLEDGFTIYGYTGSQAETYANENNIKFVALDEDDSSSKCGDNAYWSFDDATGTLTISGTGAIYDYSLSSDSSWFSDGYTGNNITTNFIDYLVKNIVIEDGITHIGDWAFTLFSELENVELPNTLTSIGDGAFCSGSIALKSITIPKSVVSIGEKAMGYDAIIYFDKEDMQYKHKYELLEDFTIQGYTGSQAETYANENNIKFVALDEDDSSSKCGDNAYWSFDDATGTLTISGTGAMYDYNNLYGGEGGTDPFAPWFEQINTIKKVVIEDGITYISAGFLYCKNLTEVSIPDSVTEIANIAFRGCTSLKSVTIPKSVTKIGTDAFGFIGEESILEGFTIYGYANSEAQHYVDTVNNYSWETNKITFVALDDKLDDSEENLRNIVENFIPDSLEIVQFCYDDFNKDGVKEAFVVAGVINNKDSSYSDCSIMLVTPNGVEYETDKYDNPNGNDPITNSGVLPIVGMESTLNETPINTDKYKFFVWEINDGTSDSTSIIIGYDGKTVFFPYPSYEISMFKQVDENIVGIEHDSSSGQDEYVNHYYKFDTATMNFVETEKTFNDVTTEPNDSSSPPTSDNGVLPLMMASVLLGVTTIVAYKKKD